LALLAGASPAAAKAATGFRDFAWTAKSVNGPTAQKPQSKLWYNDGAWWGDLFDRTSNTWRIYRLDSATQTWSNTGTTVDDRPGTWADALWDGAHLYIASAGTSPTNGADKARLYRFSYSPSTKAYTSDGPPTTIANYGMEAIVIDKDSTGALWATWTHSNQVYVNTGNSTNGAWGTPFVMPGSTAVDPDDISSVVSFKGNIGVMWSNQVDQAMYFGQHADGAPAATWATPRKVVDGAKMADDHINLKSLQEINGQIFATVKTSLGDIPGGDPNAPLIMLLKRDAAGTWSTTTVSTVKDDQTRPIVMLNPSQDTLYVFATTPVGGGTIESGTAETAIFYKTTSMSSPSFGPGPGTPFIQTDGDLHINDATSTKQTVTAGSGVVVLASDNVSGFYMHGVVAPTAAPAPPGAGAGAGAGAGTPGGTTSAGDTGSTPVTRPVSGPGPVAPGVCTADRTAVVRWSVPKHLRMSSIVVTVAGKRYAKLKGSRHSVAVRLGSRPGTFQIEIRGRTRTGKRYSARRTVRGCASPGGKALRLTRVVHKT
jgi:hypothetical protein